MLFTPTKLTVPAFVLLLFLAGVASAQETSTGQNTEESHGAASTGSEQTAVIQITDPDIAAADDEEPDCE